MHRKQMKCVECTVLHFPKSINYGNECHVLKCNAVFRALFCQRRSNVDIFFFFFCLCIVHSRTSTHTRNARNALKWKKKKNSFTQNEFTINRTDRLDVAVAVIVSFRFVSPCWPKRMKALFFCIEMRLCLCVFVCARSNEQLCTRMSWSLSFAVECRIKIDEFVLKCDNRQTHRALKQRQTKRHRNQVEIGWKSWIDEALKYRPHTHANAHTKLNYHKNGIYFDLFVVLTHSRKKKKNITEFASPIDGQCFLFENQLCFLFDFFGACVENVLTDCTTKWSSTHSTNEKRIKFMTIDAIKCVWWV